jgi:hypothetical protein
VTVVVAAVVSVVGLIVVELVRRAIEKRRTAAGAADDRGAAYEAFISEALEAIAIAQRVTSLAPRVALLPPNRYLRDALSAMEKTQATIGRLHARVRRVAPDDFAEAADAVLDVVARAGHLVRDRDRGSDQWDDLWTDAREARIEFECRARCDAGRSASRR